MSIKKFHPLADILPLIDGDEFRALVDDIHTWGLIEPIILFDGKILDGRNRYRACRESGIEPTFETYRGDNPAAFVISKNLKRRHLDESQRAMVAGRVATLPQGRRQTGKFAGLEQSDAAALLHVGERSIRSAATVLASGDAKLIAAVDRGVVAVSRAAALANHEPDFRAAVLDKIETGIKPTEALRQVRRERLPDTVERLPKGKYRVIYADPPWLYNDSRQTGDHRESTGVDHHFASMSVEEICALDVRALAADDSVLLMYGTFPLMPEALRVIEAWGFHYKTAFVWDKSHGSFGHYHDAEAELLFVATLGSCTPDVETKEKQIQRFPRERHSAKPEAFRALIDRLWSLGPRVELFRRGTAPAGWTIWGAEALDSEAA